MTGRPVAIADCRGMGQEVEGNWWPRSVVVVEGCGLGQEVVGFWWVRSVAVVEGCGLGREVEMYWWACFVGIVEDCVVGHGVEGYCWMSMGENFREQEKRLSSLGMFVSVVPRQRCLEALVHRRCAVVLVPRSPDVPGLA